jgi:hypothetical protein
VGMSLILYVGRLGFYSDDWSFIGNFSLSNNQSFLGLLQTATTPNTQMRPVQNIYDSILYLLFNVNPLGYHLVNALIIIAMILSFYFVLRQLKMPRIIAVATPLVYAFLPNYSTDRFWYASFQTNLSILFYFLSLYTGLKAFTFAGSKTFIYKMLSIFSLFISILSYEITLPLFFLNAILFWNTKDKTLNESKLQSQGNKIIFILLTIIALLCTIIFKVMTTIRLDSSVLPEYSAYLITLLTSIFQINYGQWLFSFPKILSTSIANTYSNHIILIVGISLFVIIFSYLYSLVIKSKSIFPSARWLGVYTFLSIFIFILGYSIFFTNTNVGFSLTGIENRVAIAAVIGVAIAIIGVLGLLSKIFFWNRLVRLIFCLSIALVCTSGFFIINTIASFWIGAYEQQKIVLSDIYREFPQMPKNSTLLLDGDCPYVGPASVFESQWDLKGALQTHYHDKTLQADIVSPSMQIKDDGVYTQIYNFKAMYTYKNLFVYNERYNVMYPLPNAKVAKFYFQLFDPLHNNSCPAGFAGNGVNIFQ